MSRKGTEITLKQKAKDEERIKKKSIKLVRDMHHNNATTQKPGWEGNRVISLLTNTDNVVVNAETVGRSSHLSVIRAQGGQYEKEAREMETSGGAFEGHWKWLALQDHQERGKSIRSSCLKSWEHDMFYYLLLV